MIISNPPFLKHKNFGTKIFYSRGSCRGILFQREKPGWDEEIDMYEKRLRSLCQIAEENGVLLAPEPEIHCILRTSHDLLTLMDTIQSPALCVNFDIGHSFLTDPDPIAMIHAFWRQTCSYSYRKYVPGAGIIINCRSLENGDMIFPPTFKP